MTVRKQKRKEVAMTKNIIVFTGNQLKVFALICMTLDHIGVLLFPQYLILRYIGRLSMPVFAWMIAEGCRHTQNRFMYLFTIALLALACQAVYWVVDRSLMQCILVTFSLSVILIYALDFAIRKKGVFSYALLMLAVSLIVYICIFLPERLFGFSIDYGFFGVILPAVIYMGHNKAEKFFGAAVCMVGIAMSAPFIQWYSFISLPILFFYNGRRGRAHLKYLFYIYYPLHLAVLYAVAYLL